MPDKRIIKKKAPGWSRLIILITTCHQERPHDRWQWFNSRFYRFFPTYTSFIALLPSCERCRLATLTVACVALVGVTLFVQLYEEPTLREMFGSEYEEYCKNVPRWLPRISALGQVRRS
jgi:hypothetical protein